MNLTQIKSELGINTQQIIETLQDRYPKITKVAVSLATHEDEYGICLTQEAERILRKKYGKKPWWQR